MGSTFDLPSGTSPTLALVHPTEDEKLIQFKLNSAEWRGALSNEAYLRREAILSNQALTRDGGITYWILVDTAMDHNPFEPDSNTRLPLASCETYRKKALVWRNGKVQETISHGIGSVFCAPRCRKRGYAARLMQEVGKALQTHQTGNKECVFSVLFSDIGKKFYADHGWEPFNSAHVSVPGIYADPGNLPTARPLYDDDLVELCTIDENLVRRNFESRSKNSNTAVALVPDIESIRWHHAREEFVGKELHGSMPRVKGAIVGSEKGKRVWCYWTRMWYNEDPKDAKGNTLHILRLVVEDECRGDSVHEIAALLLMAQHEAEKWKLEEVEAWNPSSATVAAAQKLDPSAKVIDRDLESIASLKWYPPHDGPVADSIDWIGNEKYGWC